MLIVIFMFRPGAMLMTGDRKSGIVVSTLAEAEFYADNGFDDILYGVILSPDKFMRFVHLLSYSSTKFRSF